MRSFAPARSLPRSGQLEPWVLGPVPRQNPAYRPELRLPDAVGRQEVQAAPPLQVAQGMVVRAPLPRSELLTRSVLLRAELGRGPAFMGHVLV